TGNERYRAAALDAIGYERTLFAPESGNWRDLRSPAAAGRDASDRPHFMTAWCHGAPGIGLARLRSLPHLDDTAVRAEIQAALAATLAAGFDGNQSLCHGSLGTLELLTEAAATLDSERWAPEAGRAAARVLDRIGRTGWSCGAPLGVETPGLMTGLAG